MSDGLYVLSVLAHGKFINLTTKDRLSMAPIQVWIEGRKDPGAVLTITKKKVDVTPAETEAQDFAWLVTAELSDATQKVLAEKSWRAYGLSEDMERRFAGQRVFSLDVKSIL